MIYLKKKYLILLAIAFGGVYILLWQPYQQTIAKKQEKIMETRIQVELEINEEIFQQRYADYKTFINKGHADSPVYKVYWPKQNGKIHFTLGENDAYGFDCDDIVGFTYFNSDTRPKQQFADLKITAGLNPNDWMDHDQARQKMMQFLSDRLAQGWTRYIPLSSARLTAESALKRKLSDRKSYIPGLDARLPLSLEQWMQGGSDDSIALPRY
jgi:hypothetical protein